MKKILLSALAISIANIGFLASVKAMEGVMVANSSTIVGEANLGVGSRGTDVVTLQSFLESKGFLTIPNGIPKGYFGQLTRKAVADYQTSVGVISTGFFGPLTRAKINGVVSGSLKGVMVGGALMTADKDIVDNAVNANNVTTVVAAVKAAGLVETLKSAGPFTVFAPTNAAFAKLPAGTVETLVKPENKKALTEILTYHVVAGRYTTSDLYNGLVLKTVNGKTLTITKVNGVIGIGGETTIETPNVISTNGVTHVIDSVLLPPQN